jgi:tungstate transport system ATP-binding protein
MLIVETRSLAKKFGEKIALRDINLRIERGDFFAVVGPSGSGKTTLLRLLDLLDEPSHGQMLFDGVDTASSERDRLALRRRIGIVFQQSVMFTASVFDNVAYPLKVRGANTDLLRKVSEILSLVGLTGFKERRATTLSGGEMQRVSLAQAMVFEPELLLLDEPTANLDPENTAIIEEIVSKINCERKVTVIMATHNMLQVEHLASTAAVLRQGELTEIGSVDDIFKKPSDFLASFARLQNVYSGQARPIDQGLVLVDLGNNVKIEVATQKTGNVMVFIRPEEIIVSTSPIVSSARNMLKGKVIEVLDLNRQVQIKVDAGKEFTAIVTRKSFEDMRLNLGSQVYLNFKASAVHVT